MSRARPPLRRAAALALGLLALPAPARAQQAPAAPVPGLTLEAVVRTTLEQSAQVRSARWDVEASRGAVRSAQGAWDPRMEATVTGESQRSPFIETAGPGISRATGLEYGLGVARRFRWGLEMTPSLSFARADAPGADARNQGIASLDLAVPLLRGRGGGAQAAGERAAFAGERASVAELRHARAGAVVRAVEAFWEYAAAVRRLEVLRGAEERGARMVEDTRALVQADARPAVDLVPVRASLASKRASRISGEQGVTAARQGLALAMGISPEALLSLPAPATAFPDVPDTAAAPLPTPARATELAVRNRADLAGARGRREAAAELLRGARAQARPQLDLGVRLAYSGLESGQQAGQLFSPFYSDLGGLQARVDLSYAFPLGNRAAAGDALSRDAADRQAELRLAELERAIALDAASAAETLRRSREELELFAEARGLHESALDGEVRKFRLGTSTVFDVIFAEDALTSATLAEIDARRRFAVALARLRFQTGTLAGGDTGDEVDVGGLSAWGMPAAR